MTYVGSTARKGLKVDSAHGQKIQDFALQNECIGMAAICSYCQNKNSKLEIFQENTLRNGLAESLFIQCTCRGIKTNFNTSARINGQKGALRVNRQSVIASQSRQQLAKFFIKMDLPPPVLNIMPISKKKRA